MNKRINKYVLSIIVLILASLILAGCQTATAETPISQAAEAQEPAPTEPLPPTATSPPPTATEEPSPTPIPPTDTPEPTPTRAVTVMQGELTIFTEEDGLFSTIIFQVLADASGRIWVVSGPWYGSDISVYDGFTWISHTADLPSSGMFHVNEAPDGSIWVAMPAAGQKIAHFDGESWSVLQMDLIGNFETFDLTISEEQTVWVLDADHGKIRCYEGGEWVNYDIGAPLKSSGYPGCHSINLANDSSPWVSCGNLFHFDQKSQTYESIQPGAYGNLIASAFTIDSAGMFWIGTDKGLSTYDGKTWTDYNEEDGLWGKRVSAIDFSDDGIVYLGTDKGVSVFNGEDWFAVEVPKEYLGSGIATISLAPDGSLWFGNKRALFHFVPEG